MPPNGTAGLARSRVSGHKRSPCPPASNTPMASRISDIVIVAGSARELSGGPPRPVRSSPKGSILALATTLVGLSVTGAGQVKVIDHEGRLAEWMTPARFGHHPLGLSIWLL